MKGKIIEGDILKPYIKMKKTRTVLKKWVEVVLLLINLLCVFIMASDSDDFIVFVISHVSGLTVFTINSYLLYKYSRYVED